MLCRWAPCGVALGLVACVLVAPRARSQTPGSQRGAQAHRRGSLSQNQPNPFSRHTTIPFSVGGDGCTAGTQRHVVTIRIYNILSQIVAFAALNDSASAADSSSAAAKPRVVSNLDLACGTYAAHWDGTRPPDGREAPPGVYMYQLVIDGHPSGMRKMLLTR